MKKAGGKIDIYPGNQQSSAKAQIRLMSTRRTSLPLDCCHVAHYVLNRLKYSNIIYCTSMTTMEPISEPNSAVKSVVISKEEINALPIQGFPEPGRIVGGFQTIFANESTPTDELTFGIARFPAKNETKISYEALHRNTPAEFYYIIQGHMYFLLEGKEHRVSAGHAIFIPGGGEHGFCNPSYDEELVFVWGLATPGSNGIESKFSEVQPDWAVVKDW